MKQFDKPRIFISKCLGQANCRYDGTTINSDVVEGLGPFVEYITACPEMDIGLPAPREALRIIRNEDKIDRIVNSKSGLDMTEKMQVFSADFLGKLKDQDLDGFILKDRSPSCGIGDVKIYKSAGKSDSLPGKTTGIFGAYALNAFPNVPLETEGRLLNFNIREHFMIRVFTMRDFKKVKASGKMSNLVAFHASNKYLLMAFSQKHLSALGKLTANHERRPFEAIVSDYEAILVQAMEKPLSTQRNINVLLHVLGYFKQDLNSAEKSFFLENLELYHQKRIPFSVMLSILKSWIVRFDTHYLKDQTLFEPFPATLFQVTDSGKGI